MNVLITCAGRRAYLVEYFREAVKPLGGHVVTANSEFFAAGLLAGDRKYVVPKIGDPQYLPTLLKIVADEKISLVLSLFDVDLPVLASARSQFKRLGAEVAISDPETIEIAGDKWRMFQFFTKQGIPTPRTWLDPKLALKAVEAGEASFPLFVKPRWGMGSIGIRKVTSPERLQLAFTLAQEEASETYLSMMSVESNPETVVIQEFVSGTEYGADVLNNFVGEHIATSIKQKLAMRSGETDIAVSVDDAEIVRLCKKISLVLKHRGNLDVDIIKMKTGELSVLEVNARFGGGYPFSHLAGARFPDALVQLVQGKMPEPGVITPGVYGLKDISLKKINMDLQSGNS